MSLITRCPTCETMFKIVPDQLRVSEGWVRCGQCAEIFDATQNMVAPAESEPAAAPAVRPSTVQAPAPETPREPWPAPAPASEHSFFVRPAEPQTPQSEPQRAQAETTNAQTDFLAREPETDPGTQALTPEPEAVDLSFADSTPTQPCAEAERAAELDQAPVTFLRDTDKASIWRRPAVRWSMALVALALLALLILQVVRMQRDRIAAVAPATRPMLQAMCELTNCDLAPLRQIESIVIDSSSFSRVRGDDYRLGFALRNTALIAIAMPSIELSLTDAQDQSVIRRVIEPAEFASGTPTLAKATVWSGSLALSVRPGTHTDHIAGYRLLAFYP